LGRALTVFYLHKPVIKLAASKNKLELDPILVHNVPPVTQNVAGFIKLCK